MRGNKQDNVGVNLGRLHKVEEFAGGEKQVSGNADKKVAGWPNTSSVIAFTGGRGSNTHAIIETESKPEISNT